MRLNEIKWEIKGKKGTRQQRIKWLESITDSMGMNLRKLWHAASPWGHKESDTVTEQQQIDFRDKFKFGEVLTRVHLGEKGWGTGGVGDSR